MILSIKKRTLIIVFVLLIFCGSFIVHFSMSRSTLSPVSSLSIIIDAGHGGLDVK